MLRDRERRVLSDPSKVQEIHHVGNASKFVGSPGSVLEINENESRVSIFGHHNLVGLGADCLSAHTSLAQLSYTVSKLASEQGAQGRAVGITDHACDLLYASV